MLFLPFLSPERRADAESHLLHILASLLISGVLQTETPFVVSIPAMVGLVLSREPRVTRSGANILRNLNSLLLLVGEVGSTSKDLLIKLAGHVVV